MSKLTRYLGLGTMIGTLAVAATPMLSASASTTPVRIGAGAEGLGSDLGTGIGLNVPDDLSSIPGVSVPNLIDGLDDFQCVGFEYNIGPLGPLGPWGPYGPLHDRKHPKCWGGGPNFDQ